MDQRAFLQAALALLIVKHRYSQKDIGLKLKALGYKVGPSTLTNLKAALDPHKAVDDNRRVSADMRSHVAAGLEALIAREIGKTYDEQRQAFSDHPPADWQPLPVFPEAEAPAAEQEYPGFTFYPDGRLPIGEKTEMIRQAREEVIILGLRLHTFSTYFFNRSDSEFSRHIEDALERRVNIKCAVLNPRGKIGHAYFQDRALVQPGEEQAFAEIPAIIEKLREVCHTLNARGWPGKISLYQYNNFPYYHAQVADGRLISGKMIVSPYLYGIRRANVPVLYVDNRKGKELFAKYWTSIGYIMEQAQQLA